MEMISENRRKRGRPPEFTATELAFLGSWFPDVKTRRGLHNIGYRQRALGALMHDKQFAWLCDIEEMHLGTGKSWKPAILVELGRLKDSDLIREVAAILCERKPKTRDAVDIIRRVPAAEARPAQVIHRYGLAPSLLLGYPRAARSIAKQWSLLG